MLQSLVAYGRGAGVDTRWLVVDGDPGFFAVTKRLHNHLHGSLGDGGPLGAAEHAAYDELLAAHREDLVRRMRPGDIVLLHDPQTAGFVETARAAQARVIWRCHVGSDATSRASTEGWSFLREYVESADALVFSRAVYAPDWVQAERLHVIAPAIDPLSVKNRRLTPDVVDKILAVAGIGSDGAVRGSLRFRGRDGLRHTLRRRTDLVVGGQAIPLGQEPLVVQVSRWDRLKDMNGVMDAFSELIAAEHADAHLILAGPATHGVSDDPEGSEVLADCVDRWEHLPAPIRRRVHLVRVPLDDPDENAVIVNALQRRASVVVQKSLAEGFGLTVTEAMWKARPLVASAVGGIVDQVRSGVHGLLVDPVDPSACGRAVNEILRSPALAAQLGVAAHRRVQLEFLADRQLRQLVSSFDSLLEHESGPSALS
jgi:trehalose synthase